MRTDDLAEPCRPATVAFDDFYRSRWAGAVRTAALLTQNPAAAEEVAQDAFVEVHRRWDHLDSPAAYLRTCLVNAARQQHRRRSLRARKHQLIVASNEPGVPAAFTGELADGVARLPDRQRAAIVLRYWCQLTIDDIAATLDLPAGTVKSDIHRALRNLSKEYGP